MGLVEEILKEWAKLDQQGRLAAINEAKRLASGGETRAGAASDPLATVPPGAKNPHLPG
jgi:hypothetical protein